MQKILIFLALLIGQIFARPETVQSNDLNSTLNETHYQPIRPNFPYNAILPLDEPSKLNVRLQIEPQQFQPSNPPPIAGCGVRNSNGVGLGIVTNNPNAFGIISDEAKFGELPWQIAIFKIEPDQMMSYMCGGSLIEPGVVLTAAHCVKPIDKPMMNKQDLKIRGGVWDIMKTFESSPYQDRAVREIVIHPDYEEKGLRSDIALLFLAQQFQLAPHINTICLPNPDDVFDHARCFASGWGKDKYGDKGKYQVILKRVEVPVVPNRQCIVELRKTRLGSHFELGPSFICAGGRGSDTCSGDGGSPLVCPIGSGRYVQAGIVSFGIGCGETPGVYINVPMFRNWIDHELDKDYNINPRAF